MDHVIDNRNSKRKLMTLDKRKYYSLFITNILRILHLLCYRKVNRFKVEINSEINIATTRFCFYDILQNSETKMSFEISNSKNIGTI